MGKDGGAIQWGHAPTTMYDRDCSICDGCGAPATKVRDFSIQLPDYRGLCDRCDALLAARQDKERDDG